MKLLKNATSSVILLFDGDSAGQKANLASVSVALAVAPASSLDEDVITRMLGDEAVKVLQSAREAAAQIRSRAEEGAARLLRDATEEAQRLREDSEVEAARRRSDAAGDAEAGRPA